MTVSIPASSSPRGMLDLEGVRSFMNMGPLRLLLFSVLIGIGAYLMLSTDVFLGALSLSFVPFVAWRSTTARLRLREMWFALQERMAVLGRIMDENLTGIRVVRAFGAEPYELDKYQAASDHALALAGRRIRTRVSAATSMNFAFFAAMGLVLWVGGLRVVNGYMTVGTLTEFIFFMTLLQQPVRQLGMVVNAFARASHVRCAALGGAGPGAAHTRPGRRTVPGSYRRRPGIRGRVLCLRGRRSAAGASRGLVSGGAGQKPWGSSARPAAASPPSPISFRATTDVTGGRITVDGQDIRDVTLDSLRRSVRVVQQDPFLFTVVVGEQHRLRRSVGRRRRHPALRRHPPRSTGSSTSLPDRYDTLVGERGVSLSGGQKQRVAIARTAMLRPAVLVLDDSMAAIDAGTEQRIRKALKEHAENCATLIVSHRLGALRHADEIIFIEDGRVMERGTHDELVALRGRYAALFALQTLDGPLQDIVDLAAEAGAREGTGV